MLRIARDSVLAVGRSSLGGPGHAAPIGAVAADRLDCDVRGAAAAPARQPSPARSRDGDIVPGSVGRSSLMLDATYDADPEAVLGDPRDLGGLDGDRSRNTSGGPIDRIELNTIAARLGGMRLGAVDRRRRRGRSRRVSDQTIVVPLGGILPAGGTTRSAVRYRATLRSTLSGSNWLFTQGQRDRRPLPLAAVGQPGDRLRPAEPRRPVRDARRAGGQGPDRRPIASSCSPRPATGSSVSADGLTQTFAATNVRDFTVTAAPDFRTGVAGRARHDRPGLLPTRRARRGDPGRGRGRLRRVERAARRLSAPGLQGRPVGRRRTGWNRPGSSGSRPGSPVEPALPRRPRDGPPVVLRHRRQRPGEAAVRRRGRGRLRRRATSWACGAPAAARPARSTGRSTRTRATCYYEKIYIQGGNLLDDARQADGLDRVLGRLARLHQRQPERDLDDARSSTRSTPATPIDLGATLFAPRFPRIY